MTQPAQPWHVPVRLEDVPPETGLHLDLVADEQVRAGLAKLTGVVDMPRLEAVLDVVRHGNGLRVTGSVSATVGQICVVTLEPLQNEMNELIDVIFAPPSAASEAAEEEEEESGEIADEPEALSDDGAADLGVLAAEFLMLGIDPYPRKPGAAFTPPVEQGATLSPFAALARIKDAKN
jgi:Large ribosomal RNA subunit accumulation protein YceD